eukprot:3696115-Pyramimonas_sp.AAC.1
MDMEELKAEELNVAAYVSSVTSEMERLLSRINLTINALNLALSTVIAEGPRAQRWLYVSYARNMAVDRLRSLRLGRLQLLNVAGGDMYSLVLTTGKKPRQPGTPAPARLETRQVFSSGCRCVHPA